MRIEQNQSLLFIGDSITDCGRERPVGHRAGLGDGYVHDVNALLAVGQPDRLISVFNTGINGNRITDLAERWQTDVLNLDPDWLAVMIGINDVWRQFDSAGVMEQVDAKTFEITYRELLYQTRPRLKGLVLMSPYFLESSREDPMRSLMDEYRAVVKELAGDYDAVFVDVQAAFDRYLAHRPTQSLSQDRVHPNAIGHVIIASAFLSAVGFDWNGLHP